MRRRRATLATLLLTAAMSLAGCGSTSENPGEGSGDIKVFTVNLPDGRSVLCVSEKRHYSGGLSCDWSDAS